MLKRLWQIIIILVFFASILVGCVGSQYRKQKISQITNVKHDQITKIVFSDGRGGINKPFTLEDKKKISEFMELLDKYVVKKQIYHVPSTGWIHMADFYNGDKKLMRITFTDPLQIDEVYYNIVKGKLDTKDIDNFIKSADPSWNIP